MKTLYLFLIVSLLSFSIGYAQTTQNEAIITEGIDKLEKELEQISEGLDQYQEEILEELKSANIPFLDADEVEEYLKEKILNPENREKIDESIETGIKLMRAIDFQEIIDKMEEVMEELDESTNKPKSSDKKDEPKSLVKI